MTRGIIALLGAAGAPAALAQSGPFLNPSWSVGGERPGEIVAADFDGDGGVDAAVLNEWYGSVAVLRAEGGRFGASGLTYGLGVEVARAMAGGDLDGDGDVDLLVAAWGPSSRMLVNRGDGTFETRPGPAPAGNAEHAAIGDVNGDGAADVALALGGDERVEIIFDAANAGAAGGRVTLEVGQRAERVRLADLEGDGDLDVVVVRWTAYHDSVSVFLNEGAGVFGPRRDYEGGFSAQDVAVGDVTGDGILDLVAGHAKEQAVVLRGLGDGTFGAGEVVALAPGCATRLALGDVDGDGALDIVGSSGRGGVVALADGAGGWQAARAAALGVSGHGIALADVDGDRDLDWLLSDIGANRLHLLVNEGGRFESLTPQLIAEPGYWSQTLASGDINGDGRPDLVTEGFQRACVYLGDRSEPSGFRSGPVTRDVGFDITVIETGDFNADGLDDILVGALGGYVDRGVRMFLSTAAGSFMDIGLTPVGVQNHDLIAADFTGDGALDALVVGGPLDEAVALLPGLGDGRFGPAQRHETPGLVFASALDMTGDSAVDLLVGDGRRQVAQVLVNDGAGRFARGAEVAAPDPWRLAAGDLNGDAAPDIVTAGRERLRVFLSEGGAMKAPVAIPVAPGHFGLELRDMDGDGDLDLALLADPATGTPGLRVFLNDGAGGFEGPGLFWLGEAPRGLIVEDLDADGDVDAAAVARAASGTGALRRLESRMADGTCRADLNGDGALDFFDFLKFQELFSAGDPAADFTGDGALDVFDFLAFQEAFAAGCAGK